MARRAARDRISKAARILALAIMLPVCAAAFVRAQEAQQAPAADSPALKELTGNDWRSQIRVLRIGVLSSSDVARSLAMAEPFRAHMQETLGLRVELIPARDMQALIDAIVNARVDYARLSASAFATGWALCRCLEPLAAPLASDGTDSYHAIAVTRAGSGISRLVDLKDKAVVFAGAGSVSGYMVPVAALRGQGIDTDRFFSRQNQATGPEAAIAAMMRGDYDAAFAWSSLAGDADAGYSRGPLHRMVAQGRLAMDEVRIAWRSDPIPHPPQVVRANLPEALKSQLRAALFDLLAADPLAYDAAEPAFSGGFTAVTRDGYGVLLHAFTPK